MALVPSTTILSTDAMGRVAPPITASVGRDGANHPGDVFVIQSLLNDRLPKPHSPVPVTGRRGCRNDAGDRGLSGGDGEHDPPSGRVDPGSVTYYSLAAHPLVDDAPKTAVGHYGEVPQDVINAATASRMRWNVPASVTLAQWVVESAWGAAMPPDSNNPFGIKAVGDQPAVESPTREVIDGASVTVTARFRKFGSLAEAFDQHGKLLATAAVYKPAMAEAQDPDAFADALTGVYATDPQYGYTLKWVIHNYGFIRYDH